MINNRPTFAATYYRALPVILNLTEQVEVTVQKAVVIITALGGKCDQDRLDSVYSLCRSITVGDWTDRTERNESGPIAGLWLRSANYDGIYWVIRTEIVEPAVLNGLDR